MPPHTTATTPDPLGDELDRLIGHASRPRLSRFWRVAGPIGVSQSLLLVVILSFFLVAAISRDEYAAAAGLIIAPAALAYLARTILVRHFDLTRRLMNITAMCLFAFGIFTLNAKSIHVPDAACLAVLGCLAFHTSAFFWLFSDRAIIPSYTRWWHR